MKEKRKFNNILITGGAGFIGSHLCDRYIADGAKVTALDNLITGSLSNVKHLLEHPSFDFLNHDASIPFENLLQNDFDLVLHFACPASPVDFERIPLEILKVDSIGTFHALDFALRNRARFLLASTSEVYGDPLVHPQVEGYWGNVNPIGKRSCYDETKRFAEAATMAYHRKHALNTGIVRIFNTYGPRMRLNDGRVVPNLCGQALRGEALTVYGSGLQTRSFCFVDDLIDGIVALAASDFHQPVNLGNPEEYRIIDFAREVLRVIPQTKSEIEHRPLLHEDDPKQRKPDITRATEILQWKPTVSLNEGLKQTISYFKAALN